MATIHDGDSGRNTAPGRLRVAAGVNYQPLGEDEDGVILSLESGSLYRCNHTAIALLDLLHKHPTVDGLVTEFADRFAIDAERARTDVLILLDQLVEERLVEKAA
jgi:hypothetical protein